MTQTRFFVAIYCEGDFDSIIECGNSVYAVAFANGVSTGADKYAGSATTYPVVCNGLVASSLVDRDHWDPVPDDLFNKIKNKFYKEK